MLIVCVCDSVRDFSTAHSAAQVMADADIFVLGTLRVCVCPIAVLKNMLACFIAVEHASMLIVVACLVANEVLLRAEHWRELVACRDLAYLPIACGRSSLPSVKRIALEMACRTK